MTAKPLGVLLTAVPEPVFVAAMDCFGGFTLALALPLSAVGCVKSVTIALVMSVAAKVCVGGHCYCSRFNTLGSRGPCAGLSPSLPSCYCSRGLHWWAPLSLSPDSRGRCVGHRHCSRRFHCRHGLCWWAPLLLSLYAWQPWAASWESLWLSSYALQPWAEWVASLSLSCHSCCASP